MPEECAAVIVLTTLPSDYDTTALADELVTAGLAACVQVDEAILSTYLWHGELHHDREKRLWIKSIPARLGELHAALLRLHPYAEPQWLVLAATSRGRYAKWLKECTTGDGIS